MTRAQRICLALLAAFALFVVGLTRDAGATATKKTIGPGVVHPTNTPRPAGVFGGITFVSPQPSCTAGAAGQYKDANGCIYQCSGGKTVIVTRPLNNTCAYPTTGATTTPTPTVTATP